MQLFVYFHFEWNFCVGWDFRQRGFYASRLAVNGCSTDSSSTADSNKKKQNETHEENY
jgi:hypothetical protein